MPSRRSLQRAGERSTKFAPPRPNPLALSTFLELSQLERSFPHTIDRFLVVSISSWFPTGLNFGPTARSRGYWEYPFQCWKFGISLPISSSLDSRLDEVVGLFSSAERRFGVLKGRQRFLPSASPRIARFRTTVRSGGFLPRKARRMISVGDGANAEPQCTLMTIVAAGVIAVVTSLNRLLCSV
jgi:hypothetical protein